MGGADTRPPDAVPRDRGIPEPLFGCCRDACRDQHTYPAAHMRYWNGCSYRADSLLAASLNGSTYGPGWYCDECIANIGAKDEGLGLRVVRHPLSGRLTVGTCYIGSDER